MWYRRQPRGVRIPVAAIGMFAAINLLTTGLSEVWFVFPSIPFVLYLIFHFAVVRR
jgi:adenylate cyclase